MSHVQLTDRVVEVYDATVGGKAQKLRVDAVKGTVEDISLAGEGTLQTAVAVAKAFGTSFEGLVRALLIIVNGLAGAFRALAPG